MTMRQPLSFFQPHSELTKEHRVCDAARQENPVRLELAFFLLCLHSSTPFYLLGPYDNLTVARSFTLTFAARTTCLTNGSPFTSQYKEALCTAGWKVVVHWADISKPLGQIGWAAGVSPKTKSSERSRKEQGPSEPGVKSRD
ncbi:hypothetical protein FRC12_022523 [Ceratobasidium sp. 428]|nr:hypothetical protein FRC12_022523 [Ceratobasidium sp. 428]